MTSVIFHFQSVKSCAITFIQKMCAAIYDKDSTHYLVIVM